MPSLLEKMQNQSIPTSLGKDSNLKGTIRFRDAARISGTFEGSIEAAAFLLVEAEAQIKAEVRAEDLVVAGEIRGDIEVSGMVELLPGSRIHGNIRSSRIRVCDGVVFEGRCEKIHSMGNLDLFSAPVRELRKAIQLAEEEQ